MDDHELADLEAENMRLRRALRPFAQVYQRWDEAGLPHEITSSGQLVGLALPMTATPYYEAWALLDREGEDE